ncbi:MULTISPECIES: flagellar protein FlaG [unclassified Pseudoalteromonas]|uniref:flagellar protein FlaG n=1 Tax=unclassified Pseudoalteromonas TaxID=194690 RepID=UPI001B39F06C|nr:MULTISPECIES: flagellar protein FlaG [unclassified Pseudoalteromonas]MBQ4846312.1 flagellar protein FlaG [Pseudoalteromonas sp. MMG005]MBQ4848674.1 flagellar protein FlaG [Pseudoalteromonas sp. MMG012]
MSNIDPSNGIANILTSTLKQDVGENDSSFTRALEKTKNTTEDRQGELKTDTPQERQTLIDTVQKNLDKVNEFLPVTSTNLSFEFGENGDPPFIRVIDKDNDEVIREIPSEEFREVAKALDEFADKLVSKGVLLNETV